MHDVIERPGAPSRHVITPGDDGIITLQIGGFWTGEGLERLFTELRPIHEATRRRHGRVYMLAYISALQAPHIAMQGRAMAQAIKRPGDRNAIVTASILSKMQITRIGSNEGFGVFTDDAAARDWLLTP